MNASNAALIITICSNEPVISHFYNCIILLIRPSHLSSKILTIEENEDQYLIKYMKPPTAVIYNTNCTKSLTMSIK